MNFQISLMSKKILAWAVVFALTLSTIPTSVATHDDEALKYADQVLELKNNTILKI